MDCVGSATRIISRRCDHDNLIHNVYQISDSEGKTLLSAALVRTRLAAVRRELTLTDRKFIHIARECGFKNAAVLKNLFRKTYGMSMRDYRKSHRSAEEQ